MQMKCKKNNNSNEPCVQHEFSFDAQHEINHQSGDHVLTVTWKYENEKGSEVIVEKIINDIDLIEIYIHLLIIFRDDNKF